MYIILCGIFVAGFIFAGRMQRHGVLIAYTTIYGNTREAASAAIEKLAEELA